MIIVDLNNNIHNFFTNHNINHLMHSYILKKCLKNNNHKCFFCKNNKNNDFIKYDINKIDYMKIQHTYTLNFSNDIIKPDVKTVLAINNKNKQIFPTHGLCSFTKDVFRDIKFNEKYLNDISFSLGTGISFNKWKNNIDISLTIGSRESIIETIDREKYYKLNIAILSGDKWFEKRREN